MRTEIIAECGINHNGDMEIAKKLIDVAELAGCDYIKFQKRNPDVCVPEKQKSKIRETPWGTMTYLEYKKRIEFEKKEYDEIDEYCKGKNIKWSASAWDLESLDFLLSYDVDFVKIPSALITNIELLEAARDRTIELKKKLIISTGMSTIEEIDRAVAVSWGGDFAIMHCNSSYPAKIDELNLKCIQTLKNRYNCEVGYSGHEFRTGPSVSSVYLGATIIEKHITLDRTMWGTDQIASLEPEGLFTLVRGIRDLEAAYGDGVRRVTESEKPVREKLRGH